MDQEQNNDWIQNNEAYQKNRHRKIKLSIIAAVSAAVLLLLVVIYVLDTDRRNYTKGIESYYETLNSRSSVSYSKQETTQGGQAFLDARGYSDPSEWYRAIQQYETEQLSEKYGDDFTVQYRIVSTEKLNDEELEKVRSRTISSDEYLKAYRLTVKEHFVGSRDDGYNEQEIIAIKTDKKHWVYNIQRWSEYARSNAV